jgi:hypothetical protein
MKHLIHRQILDLHFATVTQAQAGQQQISQLWQERLLPIADAVFSEMAAEETIRLDTLEIDLGNLSSTNLDEWADIWREKLTIALKSALAKPEMLSKKRFSDLDGLIFFLQTGTTAWWIPSKQDFNPVELLKRLLLKDGNALHQALKSLTFDRHMIERLLHQFPVETLEKLSLSLVTNYKSIFYIIYFFEILIHDLNHVPLDATTSQSVLKPIESSKTVKWSLNELLWTAILSKSDQELIPFLMEMIVKTFFNEMTPIYKGISDCGLRIAELSTFLNSDSEMENQMQNLLREVKSTIRNPQPTIRNPVTDLGLRIAESGALQNSDSKTQNPESEIPIPKTKNQIPKTETHIPKSEIQNPKSECFIENAGLILIAPFFKTFFKNLDLLDKNAFKNKVAQQKAVLITQYLVTSKAQVFEHQLIMNKLLCGYALSESLPTDLVLTETDKNECLELLETVKSHWKALKNTRIETMQTRFLSRKGILVLQNDKHWSLTVERETIDILFEATPLNWNFSYVKLPWMAQPILTEW